MKAGILADEDEVWKRDITEREASEQYLPNALKGWRPADLFDALMHKEHASFQAQTWFLVNFLRFLRFLSYFVWQKEEKYKGFELRSNLL